MLSCVDGKSRCATHLTRNPNDLSHTRDGPHLCTTASVTWNCPAWCPPRSTFRGPRVNVIACCFRWRLWRRRLLNQFIAAASIGKSGTARRDPSLNSHAVRRSSIQEIKPPACCRLSPHRSVSGHTVVATTVFISLTASLPNQTFSDHGVPHLSTSPKPVKRSEVLSGAFSRGLNCTLASGTTARKEQFRCYCTTKKQLVNCT